MLHDIDKSGHHLRLNPAPNQDDTVIDRQAHGTVGFTYVTESSGDVPVLSVKNGRIQIYRADGTLLGQFGFRDSDGDGAVDVAKPGQTLS